MTATKDVRTRRCLPEVLSARGWSAEKIEEFSQRKGHFYEEIQHELQAVPGAVDFVLWATSRFKLALATSAARRNREATLKLLGIENPFGAMVDASRHRRPKPEAEVFLIAIKELCMGAADCWIIEDSVNGVKAAKAAGAVAVGITTTFDREILCETGADLVVDSFAELRKVLQRE